MHMSYLCIMMFWFYLVEGHRLHKKHVYNSVVPSPLEQVYNISSWVRQLHLQQCVLVEIGEQYCAVFVEYRSLKLQLNTEIQEYFLGLCDTDTLRKWKFCPAYLEKERPKECSFLENTKFSNNPARVHRRLCEVTDLASNADLCDCSGLLAGQKLHQVAGFPTCFLRPLPDSLCRPRNVCGVAACNASTLGRQIHIVQCNPKCLGGQPFCESTGPDTTQVSDINSYWSDWNELSCNSTSLDCTDNLLLSEAICINQNTGMGAIDCLGPGTTCCPTTADHCKCYIYAEDGILKLFRQLTLEKPNYGGMIFHDRNLYRRFRANSENLVRSQALQWNHMQRYANVEEEYEDNDEDVEDSQDEDIILEEEQENEIHATTTDQAEKDEIKQNLLLSKSGTEKYAFKEMSTDATQQQKSRAGVFITCFTRLFTFISLVSWLINS